MGDFYSGRNLWHLKSLVALKYFCTLQRLSNELDFSEIQLSYFKVTQNQIIICTQGNKMFANLKFLAPKSLCLYFQ